MTTEQAIQDVAMIAHNGIDRVIAFESEHANLQAKVERLRELSDEMFAGMAALGRLSDLFRDALQSPPNTVTDLFRQIDPVQAADFLDTTTGQLARLRTHGGGPRFVRWVPNSVRYRLVDLIEWQEKHLFENSIKSQESAS